MPKTSPRSPKTSPETRRKIPLTKTIIKENALPVPSPVNEWTKPLENLSPVEIDEFFGNLKRQIQEKKGDIPEPEKIRCLKIVLEYLLKIDRKSELENESEFDLAFVHEMDSSHSAFEHYMNSHAVILKTWLNPIQFRITVALFRSLWDQNIYTFDEVLDVIQDDNDDELNHEEIPSNLDEWIVALNRGTHSCVRPKEKDLAYNKEYPYDCIHPKIETVQEFSRRLFGEDDRAILNFIHKRRQIKLEKKKLASSSPPPPSSLLISGETETKYWKNE